MDLYKAPVAQVAIPSEVPSRPIRGILLGALADLVLSTVLFIAYALIVGMYMTRQGATENQVAQFFMSLEQDNTTLIASYLVGGIGSALGGYICARYSRIHEYRYGCILAFIMSLFGAYFETDPVLLMSGLVLTWIAIFSGIYWGRLRNLQEVQELQDLQEI